MPAFPQRRPLRSARVGLSLFVLIAFTASLFSAVALAAPRTPAAPVQAQSAPTKVFLPMVARQTAASTPAAPSDQDLIAAALAAGRIDAGTALLYRAYALFRDDRLPREYWGPGVIEEDTTLFAEIDAGIGALAPELQRKLRQFIARPDQPDSLYNQPRVADMAAATDSSIPCAAGWTAVDSPTVPIKVWACKTGSYAADISHALAVITPLYQAETALMGAPKADNGGSANGGDNRIDLYLVNPLQSIDRWIDPSIPANAVAAAIATGAQGVEPGSHIASGFMLLARARIGDVGFRSDTAHELFHVLQYAHNAKLVGRAGAAFWWTEATAEWAAAHFVRNEAPQQVYPRFSTDFQNLDLSLHAERPTAHPYASFIWPFFMEQEEGAQGIARTWQVLEYVEPNDWSGALSVIDTELPFAQNFHQFAIRNLNSAFGGDNPLPKRYQQLDPSFPAEYTPALKVEQTLSAVGAGDAAYAYPDTLPALRAHYYKFRFADDVRQVTFDFSGLGPSGDREIAAVIKPVGKPWKLVANVGDTMHFCFDVPDEDLDEIWFVVSNHDRAPESQVAGAIKVQPLATGCACNSELLNKIHAVKQWQGQFTFTYTAHAAGGSYSSVSLHHAASLSVVMGTTNNGESYIGSPTGLANISDSAYYIDGDLDYAVVGSGEPKPYDFATNNWSRTTLNVWGDDCEYNWHTSVILPSTCSFFNTPASPCEPDAGSLGSGQLPLTGLVLAGSANYPVRTFEDIFANGGQFYEITNQELIDLLGEGNFGTATVTWHFEPVDPPAP